MYPNRTAESEIRVESNRFRHRPSLVLAASLWSTLVGVVVIGVALMLNALDERADANIGLGMLLFVGLAITALGVVFMLAHLVRRAITAASRVRLPLSRPEPNRPENP